MVCSDHGLEGPCSPGMTCKKTVQQHGSDRRGPEEGVKSNGWEEKHDSLELPAWLCRNEPNKYP